MQCLQSQQHVGSNLLSTRPKLQSSAIPALPTCIRPSVLHVPCARRRHFKNLVAKASDGDGPQSPQGTEQSTSAGEQSFEGDGTLRLPREVIEKLKYTVFGFDTFWVTSVENYEQDGVVFKGNVRGRDPAQSYQKMCDRLKDQLGDQYTLFLLVDREDKPTVALLPKGAGSERISRFTENWVAATFALFTLLTTLNANNVPIIQWLLYPFNTELSRSDFTEALPSTLAFTAILGEGAFMSSKHLIIAMGRKAPGASQIFAAAVYFLQLNC
ncbi:hypothetical protein DUNSADRAFT_17340 [Dunaliella salina]|uniref:Uncharacterized protein n=1 Tax=Dunaliella salina TaxID=3046 RepID=A0ABQ7H054_DUNSA|nr:hypothetical protein DUNSADRAFT_17340 [Dunaliella salina]|eukprot:KAF5840237.1 hypothetical protein DUNSADRAFT_17340 [Dunaliella salina]